MFSNSHCHLDFAPDEDLDEIMKRAKNADVELVLTTGMDLQSSIKGINIAKKYDIVYAGIGFHPWNADKLNFCLVRNLLASV